MASFLKTPLRQALRSRCLSTPAQSTSQSRFASSLVFIEHKAGKMNDSTLHAVTAAKGIDGEVHAVVAGSSSDIGSVLPEVQKVEGLSKIYTIASDSYANSMAEHLAPALKSFLSANSSITHLFAAHTSPAKNLMPRLAGSLDSTMISDILSVDAKGEEFTRPIYAGNAILKIRVPAGGKDKVKIVTVRTTAFDKAGVEGKGGVPVEEVKTEEETSTTKFISEELTASERPDLSSAGKVVSGGRALKSSDQFDSVMGPLADSLGAAIGASRAAVDAGYADNSLQVGQTGKIVAPELYMAVGISGAIQHLAGMKESKLIVAINKDADAPIFQIADVGLVADLFNVVPELTEKIKAAKA